MKTTWVPESLPCAQHVPCATGDTNCPRNHRLAAPPVSSKPMSTTLTKPTTWNCALLPLPVAESKTGSWKVWPLETSELSALDRLLLNAPVSPGIDPGAVTSPG